MRWTICYFVRDLATNRIVHHEIEDIDTNEMLAVGRSQVERQRMDALVKTYPSTKFEVFVQGFNSLDALYGAWPELREGSAK